MRSLSWGEKRFDFNVRDVSAADESNNDATAFAGAPPTAAWLVAVPAPAPAFEGELGFADAEKGRVAGRMAGERSGCVEEDFMGREGECGTAD